MTGPLAIRCCLIDISKTTKHGHHPIRAYDFTGPKFTFDGGGNAWFMADDTSNATARNHVEIRH